MNNYVIWLLNLWRLLIVQPDTSSATRDYISYMSDDILVEIFSKLRPSSVAICRSVCRRWHCVTSSPYFIKLISDRGDQDLQGVFSSLEKMSDKLFVKNEKLEEQVYELLTSFQTCIVRVFLINCILCFIVSYLSLSYSEIFWIDILMITTCCFLVNRIFMTRGNIEKLCHKMKDIEESGKTLVRDIVCLNACVKRQSGTVDSKFVQRFDNWKQHTLRIHETTRRKAYVFVFWSQAALMSTFSFLLAYISCSILWDKSLNESHIHLFTAT